MNFLLLSEEKVELASTSSSCSIDEELLDEPKASLKPEPDLNTSQEKLSRGRKQIITPRLVAALDKCKVSDRNAVHILAAVFEALDLEMNEVAINRSSIRRHRMQIRQEKAEIVKNEFKNICLDAPVIHWDGKLLPSLTDRENVDRLPIIISNGDTEQILKIPALESGTGRAQAEAIFETLCEWGLDEMVQACCFDTTASNTGRFNGSCVILEQLLERNLLYLPCRHHILEIIIRAVFESKIPNTSGPNVPLFKRFQDAWPKMNKTNFCSGVTEKQISDLFPEKLTIIQQLKCLLNNPKFLPRDDYKEFLELCIIFLGDSPPKQKSISPPGAMHHARWMAKVIYSLKMYLFRNEFKLRPAEKKALLDICIFIIKIYVHAWFAAPLAVKAPQSDFELLKKISSFKDYDSKISEAALKKLLNHLWYLSPEPIAFSFFDDDVSNETKKRMSAALFRDDDEAEAIEPDEEEETNIPERKVSLRPEKLEEILAGGLEQFVNFSTKRFFQRFSINPAFFKDDPSQWPMNEDYEKARNIITKLKVTNDTAERGVKLIEEYHDKLTHNEEQMQCIVQIVSDYRKKFPTCNKRNLRSSSSMVE